MYEADGSSFVVKCSCGQRMVANRESLGKSGACAACGATISIVPSTDETTEPEIDEQHCSRCGKAFQGEWDRTHTDSGYFCHVCANFVNSDATILESKTVTPDCKAYEFLPPVPPEDERSSKAKKPGKRELQCFVAVFVIAMLFNFFLPISEWLENMSSTLGEAGAVEIGPGLHRVISVLDMVQIIIGISIPLYMVLKWAHAMPNKEAWKNVIVILFFSTIMAGIGSVFLPFMLFFLIWLFFYHFDLGFREFIVYVFACIASNFLVTTVYKFIMTIILYNFRIG